MQLLYGCKKIHEDTYEFKINQGGNLNIRVSNESDRHVSIVFINGKLESVRHNLGDFDLRSNWHVYGAISEKIKELEAKYVS